MAGSPPVRAYGQSPAGGGRCVSSRHTVKGRTPALSGDAAAATSLHVEGRYLRDSRRRVVRLQGVNIPSLEWSNTGDRQLMRSVQVAIGDWHANAIRLPLAQDRWFGKAEGQADGGAAYRAIVDRVIAAARSKGCYVILDLHWSDRGEWGRDIGQHSMPDMNSLAFWRDAAKRYEDQPAVLFDLYNEPRDVSWSVWRDGGDVTERGVTYRAPGLQTLLTAIRRAGARNVVVAGGLDWGYDLSGVAKGYALSDPDGNGVIYSAHVYPWKGTSPDNWDPHVTVTASDHPILIGEIGCEPDPKQESPYVWAPKILNWIDRHGYNWTAWTFHPSASPRLLLDWNYTPTPYWGRFVKDRLDR